MNNKANKAFLHILKCYPELRDKISAIGPLALPSEPKKNIADAVTRTIIGQMLSRHAAQTIYKRVVNISKNKMLDGAWQLTVDELTQQGVSRRKAKAITDFGSKYDGSPIIYDGWHELEYRDLVVEVSKHWGLSTWSADILSIFYFGFENVFPYSDGTVQRVIDILNDTKFSETSFSPDLASPYKSYLALFLWKMNDQDIL